MKRLVMILFVFWGLAMEGAWVEAQTPTGDSFVKGEMKSGDEYVELLRLRSSRVVPTPSQVLAAFQARDPEARLKNLSDLYPGRCFCAIDVRKRSLRLWTVATRSGLLGIFQVTSLSWGWK